MATRPSSAVIEHLRGILSPGVEAIETDERLLHRFVSDRDENAFAVLVRRHGPMVLGVCLRTARNREDAEDAFQATFLVLASKADSIASRALLGHWLYGVAYNTARKARAVAIRHRLREQQVEELPDLARADQDPRPELYDVLDEELNRLPEEYRSPIVLCYLEGKTQREAARHLGCPEKTLSSRLARARDVLAMRLTRRGLVITGGSLAVALSQNASTAGVPPALLWSTLEAAHLFTATPEMVSDKVTALTERVLKTMYLSKLRKGVIVAVLSALVVIGAGTAAGRMCAAAPRVGGVAVPSAAGPNERSVSNDGKKPVAKKGLDGGWLLVGTEENGKKKSFPDGAGITVGFNDDEITTIFQPMSLFGEGGTSFTSIGKFKAVKPAGDKPAGIDLLFADPDAKPWKQGIYKLDGDVLTICWGEKDRPTEFTAKSGSGNRMNVFERLKGDE